MEQQPSSTERNYVLPVILIAAVLQGWALYALHWALENQVWPATGPGWLFACYAAAAFVPLTAQVLASQTPQRLTWIVVATVFLAFGYFGWHQGSWVSDPSQAPFSQPQSGFLLAFILGLIWLMSLPFVQVRLVTGRWQPEYSLLFATAWRNKLMLAEAALFTGLFWLLLVLWQALFHMLGIGFFRELFAKPIFIYPVTSVVFGIALHLIGSVERLTNVLLEQLLNVLKWLAIVAGVLLIAFTIPLLFKLPGMISSQDRPISAAWLLWLLAFLVLLINAAYRDGTVAQPYPRAIGLALRCAIPLTIVIALTALYAVAIRINRYGFTVDRVWACVVALVGVAYAIGYSAAVRSKHAWMSGIARVNVGVALALIAVLMLTLTPVLSPYRLAANSQFHLAKAHQQTATQNAFGTPLQYLRFDAGRYGVERLRELANSKEAALAELAAQAQRFLNSKDRWASASEHRENALANLKVYPAGLSVDEALLKKLHDELATDSGPRAYVLGTAQQPFGLFIDLNGDDAPEFVLINETQAVMYKKQAEGWTFGGMLLPVNYQAKFDLPAQLESGEFGAEVPRWRELRIGERRFRLQGEQ